MRTLQFVQTFWTQFCHIPHLDIIVPNMHCKCNAYFGGTSQYDKSNTNVLRGAFMGNFKIPVTPSTTNKTIRFPNDVIEAVEKAIQGKECTFSAFVIAAVKAALEDLES